MERPGAWRQNVTNQRPAQASPTIMVPSSHVLRFGSSIRRPRMIAPTAPISTVVVWQADQVRIRIPVRPSSLQHHSCFAHAQRQMTCQKDSPEQRQACIQPTSVQPSAISHQPAAMGRAKARSAKLRSGSSGPPCIVTGASGSQPRSLSQ